MSFLENETLFLNLKKRNQLISTLIPTQQQLFLRRELNPNSEELNEKKKIEKKNVVHSTGI